MPRNRESELEMCFSRVDGWGRRAEAVSFRRAKLWLTRLSSADHAPLEVSRRSRSRMARCDLRLGCSLLNPCEANATLENM